MTEKEAFNDNEMKVIILLSGYVRKLQEGNDYEETTYETAKRIVKIFSVIENKTNSLPLIEGKTKGNIKEYNEMGRQAPPPPPPKPPSKIIED